MNLPGQPSRGTIVLAVFINVALLAFVVIGAIHSCGGVK